ESLELRRLRPRELDVEHDPRAQALEREPLRALGGGDLRVTLGDPGAHLPQARREPLEGELAQARRLLALRLRRGERRGARREEEVRPRPVVAERRVLEALRVVRDGGPVLLAEEEDARDGELVRRALRRRAAREELGAALRGPRVVGVLGERVVLAAELRPLLEEERVLLLGRVEVRDGALVVALVAEAASDLEERGRLVAAEREVGGMRAEEHALDGEHLLLDRARAVVVARREEVGLRRPEERGRGRERLDAAALRARGHDARADRRVVGLEVVERVLAAALAV